MDREYDIFEKFPDDTQIWRTFVRGLVEARERVRQLSETSPNEFFAIHTPTGDVVARSPKRP